jgi:hypothetical protein
MLAAVAVTLTLGMTACENKAPEKASEAPKSVGQAASDAAKATGNAVGDAAKATGSAVGDAAKATGDVLAGPKDAAVKAAEETLNGLERNWQDLQAKAAPTTDAAKTDLQQAQDEMAQTLAQAKTALTDAKDASADAWQQNVGPALAAALAKAQKLYEDTAAKFSGK